MSSSEFAQRKNGIQTREAKNLISTLQMDPSADEERNRNRANCHPFHFCQSRKSALIFSIVITLTIIVLCMFVSTLSPTVEPTSATIETKFPKPCYNSSFGPFFSRRGLKLHSVSPKLPYCDPGAFYYQDRWCDPCFQVVIQNISSNGTAYLLENRTDCVYRNYLIEFYPRDWCFKDLSFSPNEIITIKIWDRKSKEDINDSEIERHLMSMNISTRAIAEDLKCNNSNNSTTFAHEGERDENCSDKQTKDKQCGFTVTFSVDCH